MGARFDDGIAPLRLVEIRIEKSARDPFVEQMRQFAVAFDFTALIKPSSPDPDDVFFQMWRYDVDLLGAKASDTGPLDLKFTVGFYPKPPRPPPPLADVDVLVEGLMRFLVQVPGAKITQLK